jgi:hypothetical protein
MLKKIPEVSLRKSGTFMNKMAGNETKRRSSITLGASMSPADASSDKRSSLKSMVFGSYDADSNKNNMRSSLFCIDRRSSAVIQDVVYSVPIGWRTSMDNPKGKYGIGNKIDTMEVTNTTEKFSSRKFSGSIDGNDLLESSKSKLTAEQIGELNFLSYAI